MGNSTRSIPRKALYSKDSILVSILLYDKKLPIMSIIGNRPERGKLLIFQDCGQEGRMEENGCLTPLQWVNNTTTVTQEIPYSESLKQLVISKKHHLNTSPAIQHYLASTDANTAASNTTRANT